MADREQSAEEIFAAALDLPPEERSAFLMRECQTSPELRTLVDGLFRDFKQLGTFLDSPIAAPPPAADPPRAGSFGRYTILEPLGAGGMSTVYRAMDEKLERSVALKILTPGVLSGFESRRRFHKEALALAKLSHSAIAAVYDVGDQDGVDYLVMECVAGQTLAAKLKAGPLPVKEATGILLQIAQALEEAHERGIVHRDLKPANVMITPKGQVKVLDFGIAKLLAPEAGDLAHTETGVLIGTPLYMSAEQALGNAVDARSDLWSLGVIYFECLTGATPFRAATNLAVLHAIVGQTPKSVTELRPEAPAGAAGIVARALQKDPDKRYQTAAEMSADATTLLASLTSTMAPVAAPMRRRWPLALAAAMALLLMVAAGTWFYHRWAEREWARNEAVAQIEEQFAQKRGVAAYRMLERAERALPEDGRLKELAAQNTRTIGVTSSPAGATVEIRDYNDSDQAANWFRLGVTPMTQVRIPSGYFVWRVTKAGIGESVSAPTIGRALDFPLDAGKDAPPGMVWVPKGQWANMIDFIGWLGPYNLPAYWVDRFEVTNREYQKFVDDGGYTRPEYWQAALAQNGNLQWIETVAKFTDTTGRPGPANWVGGHYAEGQAEYPVSGVSWFEASAYAAYTGKSLPVLAQFYQTAPPSTALYTAARSNMTGKGLAPVGSFQGIGPYATYDMAGNAREWVATPSNDGRRFILGGSWRSPNYLYFDPEALSPFDRSGENGFRCVRNTAPLPAETMTPVKHLGRDFAHLKPISDSVFQAYEAMYAYPKTAPLNAVSEGVVAETADWREEKVTFDTSYRGERMSAYLFLPKNVRPPYQTVLFFPSARVFFVPDNRNGTRLGDVNFFDYVVQSGRALIYPIYEDTYERRAKFHYPGGAQNIELTTDRYKDSARALDYLATRQDIDMGRVAYMGVSMGAAQGVISATLLQDRLKTAIFLDGGYFLDVPPPGGEPADFAPRMKKPVLMVNGRYDYTFSPENSQNPLFTMLGTPASEKRHVLLETPHDVTEDRPQLVKTVLEWLDLYLGRVK